MSHSDPPTRHQQAVPQGRGMGESPDNYHSSPPRGTPAPCPPSPAPASLGSCQDRSRTEWSRPGWLGTAGREQEGFIDGTSSSLGCPQGAAPTRNSVTALPPVSGSTEETPTLGAAPTAASPMGPEPPVSLPSVPKIPSGHGQEPPGHVEALWHPHGAPGQMAPAARPVPGLITDALIFQTGTSNPGSVVFSVDLITDAGLIGQFSGKPVIKLQGWRVLGEDELGQELPVRLLTTAPNPWGEPALGPAQGI